MTDKEKEQLIERYLEGNCSVEEKATVESWYLFLAESSAPLAPGETDEVVKGQIWEEIDKRTQPRRWSLLPYLSIAASLILVFSIAYYMIPGSPELENKVVQHKTAANLLPGGKKAVLLTASGDQIVLTDAPNGVLATLGDILVSKTRDGDLSYVADNNKKDNSQPGYNTLSTPKGGIYNITLADGTRVTLDAMSSIRFPTVFNGATRDVTTSGQVYFEVAHNPSKPFRVKTNKQTIEVLGTHFNVSTFGKQSLTTTLLKGSVRVTANGKSKLLKPGEQAALSLAKNEMFVSTGIDTTEAVAWKNGLFLFNNADVRVVMDQIGRWYDVDVMYEGEIPATHFSGKIYKNIDASKVLRILSLSGLKFRIEGKKIIIMNQ